MALSVTQTPTYPRPGRTTRVEFAADTGANFVRVWVTDAPIGSSLRNDLDTTQATKTQVHQGDADKPWLFQPDRGGKYLFSAQQYTKGSVSFGGGYAGDPDGDPEETKVGAETTIEIVVGQKLSMRIGTVADRGDLELWVWDSTIRPTNAAEHGEVTPRITALSNNKARTAALSSDVVTALAALENITTTTALGNLQTVANDFRSKFTTHAGTAGSVHAASDGTNQIDAGKWTAPTSPTGIVKVSAEYLKRYRLHIETDADDPSSGGAGSGPGTGDWHDVGSGAVSDNQNGSIISPPSDLEGLVAALADLWRTFEAHRVNTDYHITADTVNQLTALPPLLDLHRHFLTELASLSPTAAPTDNPGITPLVHGAGMKEV